MTEMTDKALKDKFFQGMSFAPATVNVITSDGPAGRVSLTVSAMSSVSADTKRPTLLICINENSAAAASILENDVFCVNDLHSHQSYISDAFAGRYKDELADNLIARNGRAARLAPRAWLMCWSAMIAKFNQQ